MNRGDSAWVLVLACLSLFLVFPAPREAFVSLTVRHGVLMGFVNFAVLSTMGELLSLRIQFGRWIRPAAFPVKVLLWGLFGMAVSVVFGFCSIGAGGAMAAGLLPGPAGGFFKTLLEAFYTSFFVNAVAGPALQGAQRLLDTLVDRLACRRKPAGILAAVEAVDWVDFIKFAVLKTIPFFWVPVNTLVFLMPPEYRVVVAAYLSIFLGAFLACVNKAGHSGGDGK